MHTHNKLLSYYNYKDYGQTIYQFSQAFFENYQKPNIFGEISLDSASSGMALADSQAVHLSTAIWGSLLGGASGTPQSWYWMDYIDGQNHYGIFKSFAYFVKAVELLKTENAQLTSWLKGGSADTFD